MNKKFIAYCTILTLLFSFASYKGWNINDGSTKIKKARSSSFYLYHK